MRQNEPRTESLSVERFAGNSKLTAQPGEPWKTNQAWESGAGSRLFSIKLFIFFNDCFNSWRSDVFPADRNVKDNSHNELWLARSSTRSYGSDWLIEASPPLIYPLNCTASRIKCAGNKSIELRKRWAFETVGSPLSFPASLIISSKSIHEIFLQVSWNGITWMIE